ncbi:hypothetical protein KI387_007140, partial [Taxus chinensis]
VAGISIVGQYYYGVFPLRAPLDPAAFEDEVVGIYIDHEGDLELVAKSFESAELDFSRYSDTFFLRWSLLEVAHSLSLEKILRKMKERSLLFSPHSLSLRNCLGFHQKRFFNSLLKDNLVAKGIVLLFITDFFKEYLVDNSFDDLIGLLKRGIDGRQSPRVVSSAEAYY